MPLLTPCTTSCCTSRTWLATRLIICTVGTDSCCPAKTLSEARKGVVCAAVALSAALWMRMPSENCVDV